MQAEKGIAMCFPLISDLIFASAVFVPTASMFIGFFQVRSFGRLHVYIFAPISLVVIILATAWLRMEWKHESTASYLLMSIGVLAMWGSGGIVGWFVSWLLAKRESRKVAD